MFRLPFATVATILALASVAQSADVDMAKRAEELKNLKFGMFTNFSFSTFSGKDETIGVKDLSLFNPTGCDTDQWVSVAKEAGMGYIVFLKHADGFCLWDTKTTDRKVTKSPWGKDVLAAVRKSCDKHGVKLALYYEEGDWTWPGGRRRGRLARARKGRKYPSGMISGIPQAGGINPEVKKAQLKELLTQYGPIEFIWFDHALGDGGLNHEATVPFMSSSRVVSWASTTASRPARCGWARWAVPRRLDDPSGAGVGARQQGIGDYKGYLVAEFVITIQTGRKGPARWFYSGPQDHDKVMPAEDILELYQGAVKFGNIFSLCVTPDRAGRLREIDVKTLREVGNSSELRHRTDGQALALTVLG